MATRVPALIQLSDPRVAAQLVLYYEGRKIEFVPNFTYLGVIMQTKGGYSGHIQNLKRKAISACTRVTLRLPLTVCHCNLWRDYYAQ